MPRPLDQILTELNNVYDPRRDVYNKALTEVDPAQSADIAGLEAAKTDAFQQITDQANRRGLFYAGAPIAEEQKYTGAQFLPSLANLRTKYAQRKFDLTDALTKVTQDEYNQANSIQQDEQNREEKQREFDAQLAATRAAGGGGGGAGAASPSFGGADSGGAAQTDPIQQLAYNDVYTRISSQTPDQIKGDYLATLKSAQYGNAKDKYKIALYNQLGYSFSPTAAPAPAPKPTPIPNKVQQANQQVQQLRTSSPSLAQQLMHAFSF